MYKLIFLIFSSLLSIKLYAQSGEHKIDTIVNLQEVIIYAKKDLSIIKSANKRGVLHVGVNGKSSVVTRVDVESRTNYSLDGIEFYFNYKWKGFDNEGFYIKPLILSAEEGKPNSTYLNSQIVYFVGKEINEVIHIDLSDFNIEINGVDSFFIGIEFVESSGQTKLEDFNVTMTHDKKALGKTFTKASCQECIYTPVIIDEKFGITLKYNLYYK